MVLINCILFAVAACFAVDLSGCVTPNKPYRVDQPYQDYEDENYSLAFVEFDDQGELWTHKQLKAVSDKIRQASHDDDLLLVIYAHGWSGNASQELQETENSALYNFQHKFLAPFGKLYANSERKRHVFGVFLGWRGRVVDAGAIGIDFPNRLAAAERVSQISGTEALLERASGGRVANGENKIIIVGHSFGGIVVEDALNQALITRVIEARRTSERTGRPVAIDSPADLVVLVNQAQSATYAHQLQRFLRDNHISSVGEDSGSAISRPVIASITARNDAATGKAFPIATDIGRWFRVLGGPASGVVRQPGKYEVPDDDCGPGEMSQLQALRRTAGHYKAIHTHELIAPEPQSPLIPKSSGDDLADLKLILAANVSQAEAAENSPRIDVPGKNYSLVRKGARPFDLTPYWIFSVEPEIISGHSGFWNNNFYGLVSVLADLPRESREPGMERRMLQYAADDTP